MVGKLFRKLHFSVPLRKRWSCQRSEVIIPELHIRNSGTQDQPPGQFDIVTAFLVIDSYGIYQALKPEVVKVRLDVEMASTMKASNPMEDIVNTVAGVERYEAEKRLFKHPPLNGHIRVSKQHPDFWRRHQEAAVKGFKKLRGAGPGLKHAFVACVKDFFEGHGRLPDSVGLGPTTLNLAFAGESVT